MNYVFYVIVVWVCVAVFLVWFSRTHNRKSVAPCPVIRRAGCKKLPAGTLCRGGSSVTSKTETRIRGQLRKRGLWLLPAGVCVKTFADPFGKTHVYTPDIIIWGVNGSGRVILEVDPKYTHDKDKWFDDTLRAYCFTQLGFIVIRLRLDGAVRLTPNDVCLEGSILSDKDISLVVQRIRGAKILSLAMLSQQLHVFHSSM